MATAKKGLTGNRVQGRKPSKTGQGASQALPRLLSVHELAELLHVRVEYVTRRLVFERRIPFIKVGRRTLFDERDVAVFLATNRVTPED